MLSFGLMCSMCWCKQVATDWVVLCVDWFIIIVVVFFELVGCFEKLLSGYVSCKTAKSVCINCWRLSHFYYTWKHNHINVFIDTPVFWILLVHLQHLNKFKKNFQLSLLLVEVLLLGLKNNSSQFTLKLFNMHELIDSSTNTIILSISLIRVLLSHWFSER